MFGGGPWPWATIPGRATGEMICPATTRSSSSRAIRASRSKCWAERRSISSLTVSSRRSSRPRAAACGKDVSLDGGANVVQQYPAADLLDEMLISVVPVLLGGGARLSGSLGEPKPRLRPTQVVEAPGVTHAGTCAKWRRDRAQAVTEGW